MNWKDYQKEAKRTDAPLETKQAHDFHMIMGMVTEVGEIMDVFKKNLAYGKPIDWVNVKEEIGDIAWYLANFCSDNDFDFEEILSTNISKLKSRYPEKFEEEKALHRDLNAERKVLENE